MSISLSDRSTQSSSLLLLVPDDVETNVKTTLFLPQTENISDTLSGYLVEKDTNIKLRRCSTKTKNLRLVLSIRRTVRSNEQTPVSTCCEEVRTPPSKTLQSRREDRHNSRDIEASFLSLMVL